MSRRKKAGKRQRAQARARKRRPTHWTAEHLTALADTKPRRLVRIVLGLQARLQELQARLALNSRNSSKPPSSDGYTKPAPKSLRKKTGRNSGGQPGHPGHTLKPVKKPDHVIVHPLKRCPCGCGGSLRKETVIRYEKRQVFDLPPQKLEVTEHRAEVKCCPHSGQEVCAPFPPHVTAPTQYGLRFFGWLTYCRVQQLLPLKRITQMVKDLFGHLISEGTVQAAITRTHKSLADFETLVKDLLARAVLLHGDETGLRVTGKLHWLHILCTQLLTWYGVHRKRGHEAMDYFGILPRFTGRLIHDFLESYFHYLFDHGMCNAHILRELVFLRDELHQPWAGKMYDLLLEMHRFVAKLKSCTDKPTKAQLAAWLRRFRTLLKEGFSKNPPAKPVPGKRGRTKQSKAYNLLHRLQEHERSVLAFLHDFNVPFTNNQAEQDARMSKVQQKVSGGFRTLEGARMHARIRSYTSTARKHGIDVFQALIDALAGQPFMPRAPT
ncbi:MAG: IS66 family transposase [Pseudomonadota bacterium]